MIGNRNTCSCIQAGYKKDELMNGKNRSKKVFTDENIDFGYS